MNRSPGTRRKAKAPPPPPPSASALPCQQIEKEEENAEIMYSEENLTGNHDQDKIGRKIFTSKSVEESSSQSNQLKNIYKRLTKGFSFVSFIPLALSSKSFHLPLLLSNGDHCIH